MWRQPGCLATALAPTTANTRGKALLMPSEKKFDLDEFLPGLRERARQQVEDYERSGGTEGGTIFGKPVVILTSIGAKSGKTRKTPLMRVERDGKYLLVASMGGAPVAPDWYRNVKANPRVWLQDGPQVREYVVRELAGDERERSWALVEEAYPAFADYQARTDRLIPLLVLEPVEHVGEDCGK